ncbi:MAG: PilZ domain-containing protein [Bacillota bacterium]
MSKIWFILHEGQVAGPFEPSEIEAKVASLNDAQIWGRGHGEWMTPVRWRQLIKEIAPTSHALDGSNMWRIRVDGKPQDVMKYSELIESLKSFKDFTTVDVSADGGQTWKDVYLVQKIVDDLGISRRSHPRVPIVGTLSFENDRGESFKCRVISISEGGLGVNDAQSLQIGQKFYATLTSPNLYVTVTTSCEVVYVGNDGYAGLRFVGIPEEFKSSIVEYVNKFATA